MLTSKFESCFISPKLLQSSRAALPHNCPLMLPAGSGDQQMCIVVCGVRVGVWVDIVCAYAHADEFARACRCTFTVLCVRARPGMG